MQFLIYHLLKYILFIGADVKSQPCTQKVMEFYYTKTYLRCCYVFYIIKKVCRGFLDTTKQLNSDVSL